MSSYWGKLCELLLLIVYTRLYPFETMLQAKRESWRGTRDDDADSVGSRVPSSVGRGYDDVPRKRRLR